MFIFLNNFYDLFKKYFLFRSFKEFFCVAILRLFWFHLNIWIYNPLALIFVQAVDTDMYMNTKYYQQRLLKAMFLFFYSFRSLFLDGKCPFLCGCLSDLIILFHWCSFLFLHKYHTILIIVTSQCLNIQERQDFPFCSLRLSWIFWALSIFM